MIVAGMGCRRGTPVNELEATLLSTCDRARIDPASIRALATGRIKANETGLIDLAQRLGLPLHIVGDEELRASAPRTHTISRQSLAHTQSTSLSEAAALAVAGASALLIATRIVTKRATCALAQSAEAQ